MRSDRSLLPHLLAAGLLFSTSGCVWIVDAGSYGFAEDDAGSKSAGCAGVAPATLAPTHGVAETQGVLEGGALAIDPQGNIVAAGRIDGGDVAFMGAAPVTVPAMQSGLFVAGFGADGNASFVRGFFTTGAPSSLLDVGSVVSIGAASGGSGTIVSGQFTGDLTIGTKLVGQGQTDSFVAKLDGSGNPVWAKGFGDAGYQSTAHAVVDKAGDILIAMHGEGSFSLGPHCQATSTGSGLWIAKLGGASGDCVWVVRLPVGGSASALGLAYDPARDIGFIAGDSTSTYFGAAGQVEAFVDAFHGSDGTRAWTKASLFGAIASEATPSARWVEQVRVSGCGDLFVTGNFEKEISLGDLQFKNAHYAKPGDTEIFLAKLSPSGAVQWAQTYGHDGVETVHGLALGPGGEIAITGAVSDNPGSQGIDFGGGLLPEGAGATGHASNVFVAAFADGATGPSYRFATRLGDGAMNIFAASGLDVAIRSSGGLAVTGSFADSIRFSDEPGETGASLSYGAFIAQYEP